MMISDERYRMDVDSDDEIQTSLAFYTGQAPGVGEHSDLSDCDEEETANSEDTPPLNRYQNDSGGNENQAAAQFQPQLVLETNAPLRGRVQDGLENPIAEWSSVCLLCGYPTCSAFNLARPSNIVDSSCNNWKPDRPLARPPVRPAPTPVDKRFTIESIGGLEEHKAFLERAVLLPIVNGDVLQNWGVHPPKGVLMYGPPGTGKTYMAKALVNELSKVNDKIRFFYRKGGDVFSPLLGQSEQNLRNFFETAAGTKEAPSVIFFDEIDGLCPSRERAHTHGTEAYAAVVTCFLGLMDAVVPGETLVIGSTNRLEAVDPAVRRPGRFDKWLYFGYPDEEARKNIIKIHTSRWAKSDQPEEPLLSEMAKRTFGYSGADLEKLCHDVIYAAIEQNNNEITEEIKISPEIWQKTIANTRPMGANLFGPSIYTPVHPSKTILDLVGPAITEALQVISKIEKTLNFPQDHQQGIQKSFLLYPTYKGHPPTYLNNFILNGILCDDLFKNKILLDLDPVSLKNQVRTRTHPSLLAAINAVISEIEQAVTNRKEVVVVAPNVDILYDLSLQDGISKLRFQRILQGIKGPKMTLIATSGKKISEENCPGLLPVFGQGARVIPVALPTDADLNCGNPKEPESANKNSLVAATTDKGELPPEPVPVGVPSGLPSWKEFRVKESIMKRIWKEVDENLAEIARKDREEKARKEKEDKANEEARKKVWLANFFRR